MTHEAMSPTLLAVATSPSHFKLTTPLPISNKDKQKSPHPPHTCCCCR